MIKQGDDMINNNPALKTDSLHGGGHRFESYTAHLLLRGAMVKNFNDWITTQQAASLTGYSQLHIRRLAASEAIKAFKRGRDWFIGRESLLAYKRKMNGLGTLKHSPTKN